MSWSRAGYCVQCQCDIWLAPINGGWQGECPNCHSLKTYWCEPVHEEEPDPVDCHVLVMRDGEPTYKFTNKARLVRHFDNPYLHLTVRPTGETTRLGEEPFDVWETVPTPKHVVEYHGALMEFYTQESMDRWADSNFQTLIFDRHGDLDGKVVSFYKVTA